MGRQCAGWGACVRAEDRACVVRGAACREQMVPSRERGEWCCVRDEREQGLGARVRLWLGPLHMGRRLQNGDPEPWPSSRPCRKLISKTGVCKASSSPEILPIQGRKWGAKTDKRIPWRWGPCLWSPRTSHWDSCPSGHGPPLGLVPGVRLLSSLGALGGAGRGYQEVGWVALQGLGETPHPRDRNNQTELT